MPKPRNYDPENPPLTDAQLATAKRGIKHLPKPMQEAILNSHRRRLRGKQVAPTKELISIRLNRDALAVFRGTGRGWQARINDMVVRAAAKLERDRLSEHIAEGMRDAREGRVVDGPKAMAKLRRKVTR